MSDDDVVIDGRSLSTLKVAELKEELENRQLSTKGVKAVLQERLKEAILGKSDNTEAEKTRARTESEKSETAIPKSESSPLKSPESSSRKRQTSKSGQSLSEEVQEIKKESEKKAEDSDEKSEATVKGTEEVVPEKSESTETPQQSTRGKKNGVENEINVEDQREHKFIGDVVEDGEQPPSSEDSPKKDEPHEDQAGEKQLQKEDDGDELDYGDDEEKEQKDDESMDAEDVKEKKVVQVEEDKKQKDGVKKEEKVRASVSHRRASSPSSRHPVSKILHIRGLTRPFTEKQLRNEIEKHGGEIVDFWIDKVKSHCFAMMNSSSDAKKVLEAMHDTTWPDGNPKKLAIVFETEENMNKYKEGRESTIVEAGTLGGRSERLSTHSQSSVLGGKAGLQITLQNVLRDNDKLDSERKEKRGSLASRLTRVDDKPKSREERKRERSETPPFSKGAGFMDAKKAKHDEQERGSRRSEGHSDDRRRDDHRVVQEDIPKKSLDQLFKKTVAAPPIYYLPLTDDQIAEKEEGKKRGKESEGAQERVERSDRDRNRGERNDRGDRGDRGERSRRRD